MMRIGILGGGQLGFMTILEGRKLGYSFNVLDRNPHSPAVRVSDRWYPPEEVINFCRNSDVITYEFEHIEEEVLQKIEGRVMPSLEILYIKKSRIKEKEFLKKAGYPICNFKVAEGKELLPAVKEIGFPAVIKRERAGYDGKGQFKICNPSDLEKVEDCSSNFVIEEFVKFKAEVSVIGVRDLKGKIAVYPLTENIHKDGILLYNRTVEDDEINKNAIEIVSSLMEDLSLVGLLAVEFFLTEKGDLLINEFAPRPHNTGHYTLDGCYTSQFENLLRAISELPLGITDLKKPAGMVNILGLSYKEIDLKQLLSVEGTKLYWYGKEKRPRRKMGHINIIGENEESVLLKIKKILNILYDRVNLEWKS